MKTASSGYIDNRASQPIASLPEDQNPMSQPSRVIAIDWGTSSLRAALMAPDGSVIDRTASADGIMFTRGRSFEDIFRDVFGSWIAAHPDAVVLAGGMIGSRQGWVEAPYVDCPAGFADLARALAFAEVPGMTRLGFVPGVRIEHQGGVPDVMRGEEIQVFGALASLGIEEGIFVLPGTHSKWAVVEGGRITGFHTFLTGEMFGVLRQHSILGRLMPDEAVAGGATREQAFDRGCALSARQRSGSLLHTLFSVRTTGLFGKVDPADLPSYMSGLLIGEEIREAKALLGGRPGRRVHLVCRGDLADLYRRALAQFDIASTALDDGATFSGLFALAQIGEVQTRIRNA